MFTMDKQLAEAVTEFGKAASRLVDEITRAAGLEPPESVMDRAIRLASEVEIGSSPEWHEFVNAVALVFEKDQGRPMTTEERSILLLRGQPSPATARACKIVRAKMHWGTPRYRDDYLLAAEKLTMEAQP